MRPDSRYFSGFGIAAFAVIARDRLARWRFSVSPCARYCGAMTFLGQSCPVCFRQLTGFLIAVVVLKDVVSGRVPSDEFIRDAVPLGYIYYKVGLRLPANLFQEDFQRIVVFGVYREHRLWMLFCQRVPFFELFWRLDLP